MYIRRLLLRLQENERSLNEAYRICLREAQAGHRVSRSAEWLLDNFFLVRAQILETRQNLEQSLNSKLPMLTTGPYVGYPRVYALTLEWIERSDCRFDSQVITRHVQAYQAESVFGLSELCAIPVMLRVGLVENLKRLMEQSLAPVSVSESPEIGIRRATSVGNAITSLRLVATIVWYKLIETWSLPHRVLERDPAGAYAQSDFETRHHCRRVIAGLSKRTNVPEVDIAQRAVELAGREQVRHTRAEHVGYYLIDCGLFELQAQLRYRPALHERLSRWIFEHANWIWSFPLLPQTLPKLEFKNGIPEQARTMVVVPVPLRNACEIENVLEHFEQRFLGNRDENLQFALLTAFDDAKPPSAQDASAERARPEEARLLDTAIQGIQALNEKYTAAPRGHFYLLHRDRHGNSPASRGMVGGGNRNPLGELIRFFKGSPDTSIAPLAGSQAALPQVKYIIWLDETTELPLNAARRLVGAIAHPLNRAVMEFAPFRVTNGYGVLQPRVALTADSAARTGFERIMLSGLAFDPRPDAISNPRTSPSPPELSTDTAIYDVDVLYHTIENQELTNLFTSDESIQTGLVRTGFAADIVLAANVPGGYDAFRERQEQQTLKDWRLARQLFYRVHASDSRRAPNALRSTESLKILYNLSRTLVAPVLCVFLIASWTILPGAAWAWTLVGLFALCLPLITQMLSRLGIRRVGEPWRDYGLVLARQLGNLVQRAVLILSFLPVQAIDNVDTMVNVWGGSDRNRAAIMEREGAKTFAGYLRRMWFAPVLALLFLILVTLLKPHALPVAAPVLLIWFASPAIAAWVSRPSSPAREALPAEAQNELRLLASKMWNFFDQLATEADHWLPPDNYRAHPKPATAHRTSPTNIGCLLLAIVAAFDFEIISADELYVRLERVLNTLARMDRFCGHWCNWYDTVTLEVLHPFYVSSVDSGNLAAALIVVKQACLELARMQQGHIYLWRSIANRADTFVREMDFRFMYNTERELFAIGYDLETNRNDNKYYDLFGSEARLTSYITIALGQVPESHWFHLGRPYGEVSGRPTLLCWGGSLFEYLLPTLFLPDYPGTLSDETYAKVIARHIRYADAHSAPWGNAEAGYYAFDADCNYQYKMFGVPDLSVRNELLPEFVVPSYATFLALPYAPLRAWENLQALQRLGGLNEFGFYESFDFTSHRVSDGQTVEIVQEFMAHHQGISLAALDNLLNGNAIRRRFRREPAMAAFEFLLRERVPPHIPVVKMPAEHA